MAIGKGASGSSTLVEPGEKELKKVQALMDEAPVGICSTDLKGKVTYANKRFEEVSGYSRGEVVGKNGFKLGIFPKETLKLLAERIKDKLMGKPPRVLETQFKCKDGHWIWVAIEGRLIQEQGKPVGFQIVSRDITERKQAEEALRESREKLQRMFESVTEGISVIDLKGIITEVNQRMVEIHGYKSKDKLVGRSAFELVAPADHEKITKNMRQALKQGTVRGVEYTLLRADGTEFPGELSTSVLRDASGKWVGHITIIRDITARKQAEQALRESEEKFSRVFHSSPNAIFITSVKDRKFIEVNESFTRFTGYTREETIGHSAVELNLWVSEEEHKRWKDKLQGRSKIYNDEFHSRMKSGEIRIGMTSSEIISIGGEPCRIGVTTDITERRKAEGEEKRLQQELYRAQRLAAVGELAAGVAHEINNPLTGVLGFAQRLMRKSTSAELSRDLEIIHGEAQRAAKIVQSLLTFARRREPKKEYANINDIVQKTLELRDYALQTSNIEVTTSLAPSLPQIMVDFHQIQEVFLNIILNAEQAMSEAGDGGKLTIRTKEIKDYVRVSFTDDGPGIPPEHVDKVFDPFFTTRAEKGGTGLGLSACHGIVTEHGGRIYARNRAGKGATFFIELPLHPD